jgi:hypothetical protein
MEILSPHISKFGGEIPRGEFITGRGKGLATEQP